MTVDIHLNDDALVRASMTLANAVNVMIEHNTTVPAHGIQGITGIGEQVDLFLRGLAAARVALGDAAKTASETLAMLMHDSAELDNYLASVLSDSFAARGSTSVSQ